MLRPKKSMMRHKSQPRPVLSGQLTVRRVGSPSFSGGLMITTSSYSIPINNLLLVVVGGVKRNEKFKVCE